MASPTDGVPLNLDSGDLGLGRGWKPGAIPKSDSDDECQCQCAIYSQKYTENHIYSKNNSVSNTDQCYCPKHNGHHLDDTLPKKPPVGRLTETLKKFRKHPSAHLNNHNISPKDKVQDFHTNMNGDVTTANTELMQAAGEEEFPVFDSIPMGTSLRQHKQLFDHSVHELFNANVDEGGDRLAKTRNDSSSKVDSDGKKLDKGLLQKKLEQAHQDVDVLKLELEQSQRQLESKYRAISILQTQAMTSKTDWQKYEKKATDNTDQFQQDINKLQFEMDYNQSNFMSSQQLWTERYAKLSEENAILKDNLESRSEEMKRLTAEKMAVVRERDELLALLDVQEKERYESLKHPHSPDEQPYAEFSSSELAILGACQCRIRGPDPCQCAYAATNLKRDVIQLKQQITYRKKQHQESLLTTDAYRSAFEEQLNRNKNIVLQLAELTSTIMTNKSKPAKFKAAVKWLLQQLNEDLPPPIMNGDTQEVMTEDMLEEKTEQELIMILVDMISDKNEALAHQRLAARLMAERAKELEEKLKKLTGEDTV